jgi:heme-degrading monooxygenase HmoA
MDQHRAAQAKGRARIFDTYRIRVAQVTRDYDKERRGDAPADSRAANG